MKKKIISMILTGIMALSTIALAGCGSNDTSKTSSSEQPSTSSQETTEEVKTVDVKPVKIGVLLYATDGQFEAAQSYFNLLSKEIEGLEFVYVAADSMNAEANLSTVEGLISQGCNGIITTVGTGLVPLTEACQAQNVFVTTYLCKPDEADVQAMSQLPNYLGGVADGALTGEERGIEAAKYIIEKGFKNVGTISFPLTVMISHKESYDAFVKTIDEYNATAAEADKITLTENTELFFKPLDTSYFANNPNIDCIYSMAAGIDYAYPTMVQAGVNGKIKLVTNGMKYDTDSQTAINNGDIAFTSFTSIEQSFYPVSLIFDAVNGQKFDDAPATGTIVPSSMIYLKGAEDLAILQEKSYYFRKNDNEITRLKLNPIEAKQLLKTFNPDASYADITTYLNNLGMDAFK